MKESLMKDITIKSWVLLVACIASGVLTALIMTVFSGGCDCTSEYDRGVEDTYAEAVAYCADKLEESTTECSESIDRISKFHADSMETLSNECQKLLNN